MKATGQLVLTSVACPVICNTLMKSPGRVVFLTLPQLPSLKQTRSPESYKESKRLWCFYPLQYITTVKSPAIKVQPCVLEIFWICCHIYVVQNMCQLPWHCGDQAWLWQCRCAHMHTRPVRASNKSTSALHLGERETIIDGFASHTRTCWHIQPCSKDEECCSDQTCVWGQCTVNATSGTEGTICQGQSDCRSDLCCAFQPGEPGIDVHRPAERFVHAAAIHRVRNKSVTFFIILNTLSSIVKRKSTKTTVNRVLPIAILILRLFFAQSCCSQCVTPDPVEGSPVATTPICWWTCLPGIKTVPRTTVRVLMAYCVNLMGRNKPLYSHFWRI